MIVLCIILGFVLIAFAILAIFYHIRISQHLSELGEQRGYDKDFCLWCCLLLGIAGYLYMGIILNVNDYNNE